MKEGLLYRSRSAYFHAAHLSLGFFLCSSMFSAFNSCIDNVSSTLSWPNNSVYVPISNASYMVGSCIGTILTAPLSHKFGRRKLLLFVLKVYMIGCLITIIPYTASFIIGRFISGCCAGNFLILSPVFVNEITPDALAGKVGTLVQTASNFGLIFSYAASLLLPTKDYDTDLFNYYWMFLFIFPGFVAAYQLFYFYTFYKLDSPAWYLMHDRKEEAVNALRYIYTEEGIELGLARFGKISEKQMTYTELFSQRKYRKMLRISIIFSIFQQLSGVNVIVLYSTSIFKEIGGSIFVSRVLTLIIAFVMAIFGLLTMPLLSKYGRKTLLISGQYGLILILGLLGLFSGYYDVGVYIPAVSIYVYFILFIISLGSTFWAYLGETVNDLAMCIGQTLGSVSLVITSFSFPLLVEAIGISNCFFIFCGFTIGGVVYQHYDLFETKGKTKQEIMNEILIKD